MTLRSTSLSVGGQVSLPTGGHLDLPADGHLAAEGGRLTELLGYPPTALMGWRRNPGCPIGHGHGTILGRVTISCRSGNTNQSASMVPQPDALR